MIPERIRRVEEAIKEQLALIIQQEMKDPRLNFVSVTHVRLSKDVRNADIFITTLDESKEHITEVLAVLESANGFIRHALGQRIALRFLPVLKFHYDTTLAQGNRIESLIQKIHEEK